MILRARWPIVHGVRGGWKAITAMVQLVKLMTAVNPVYARHLTETDDLFLYVYHTSGDLWQAQTVRWWCPCDGSVYPSKTDTVSSPIVVLNLLCSSGALGSSSTSISASKCSSSTIGLSLNMAESSSVGTLSIDSSSVRGSAPITASEDVWVVSSISSVVSVQIPLTNSSNFFFHFSWQGAHAMERLRWVFLSVSPWVNGYSPRVCLTPYHGASYHGYHFFFSGGVTCIQQSWKKVSIATIKPQNWR